MWAKGRDGGSGVTERLVRLPHGVEDDGELARHGDFAFLKPAPLAILSPQAFGEEKPICRVRMTLAAS